MTRNLFKKKHIYFLNFTNKSQLKLLLRNTRITQKKDNNTYIQKTQNKRLSQKLEYNRTLLGQILTIRSNDRFVTLVSLFRFKKRKKTNVLKKKINTMPTKINLYKSIKVFK